MSKNGELELALAQHRLATARHQAALIQSAHAAEELHQARDAAVASQRLLNEFDAKVERARVAAAAELEL